jgi:putative peptidoglycan lipid II flippase
VGGLLLARGFYAQGRTWPPTLVGTLTALGCLPLYAWMSAQYGGAGLAYASSIAISIYVAILGAWAMRSLGDGDGFVSALLRLAVACVSGIAAGWGLDQVLPAWPALIRGGITGGVAATVCLGLSVLFRVLEATMMISKVRRRVLRR